MTAAFVPAVSLPSSRTRHRQVCVRMSDAAKVVDDNYPVYVRNRAPFITFDGQKGISLAMKPVKQFAIVDAGTPPLFDYSAPDDFKPEKPTPPSPISWPSGDGRTVRMRGSRGSFNQPNLKTYGPFPDFFKVCFAFAVYVYKIPSSFHTTSNNFISLPVSQTVEVLR